MFILFSIEQVFGKDFIQNLMPVTEITIYRQEIIDHKILDNPLGVYFKIMKTKQWRPNSFDKLEFCFFYKINKNNKQGEFKIVEMENEKCHFMQNASFKLSNISSLKVQMDQNALHIQWDENKLSKQLRIPLQNNYSIISSLHEQEVVLSKKTNKTIILHSFSKSAGYSNNSKIDWLLEHERCEELDNDCNYIGLSRCGQCRYGAVQGVSTICQQKGNRYCSKELCGKKGEQACYRGWKYEHIDNRDQCSQNSQIAFCENELTLICQQNELICL